MIEVTTDLPTWTGGAGIMGIIYRVCPQCSRRDSISQDMCECGYTGGDGWSYGAEVLK